MKTKYNKRYLLVLLTKMMYIVVKLKFSVLKSNKPYYVVNATDYKRLDFLKKLIQTIEEYDTMPEQADNELD